VVLCKVLVCSGTVYESQNEPFFKTVDWKRRFEFLSTSISRP
jgi:hypothetical protein